MQSEDGFRSWLWSYEVVIPAAVAVSVSVAAVANTAYALLGGAIWVSALFCWRTARELREERGRTLRYQLCAVGVLYLVPIAIAVTLQCVVAFWVRHVAPTTEVGDLIWMEQRLERLSRFYSSTLNLNAFEMLIVMVAVYVATCFLLARRDAAAAGRKGAHGLRWATGVYARFSGPVAAGLATLAAFSLFGMQSGAPADDLRLQVKVAQKGYADIAEKVEADLSREVARGLYDKVLLAMPEDYQRAVSGQAGRTILVDELRGSAEFAKLEHGVRVASVDQMVRDETDRQSRIDELEDRIRVRSGAREDLPRGMSPAQVQRARALVDVPDSRGIDLLADGQKKVVLQVEKLVSERILTLAKPLTDQVPLLEPLVQAFAEAIDAAVQERLARAYDRLVELRTRRPQYLYFDISTEAAKIVERADVSGPVERATPRAEQLARQNAATIAALEAGSKAVDRQITRRYAAAAGDSIERAPLKLRPLPRLPDLPRVPSIRPPRPGYDSQLPNYQPPRSFKPPRPVRPPVRIIPFL